MKLNKGLLPVIFIASANLVGMGAMQVQAAPVEITLKSQVPDAPHVNKVSDHPNELDQTMKQKLSGNQEERQAAKWTVKEYSTYLGLFVGLPFLAGWIIAGPSSTGANRRSGRRYNL